MIDRALYPLQVSNVSKYFYSNPNILFKSIHDVILTKCIVSFVTIFNPKQLLLVYHVHEIVSCKVSSHPKYLDEITGAITIIWMPLILKEVLKLFRYQIISLITRCWVCLNLRWSRIRN